MTCISRSSLFHSACVLIYLFVGIGDTLGANPDTPWYRAFERRDRDGSGEIDYEEAPESVQYWWLSHDSDNSGSLNFEEWTKAVREISKEERGPEGLTISKDGIFDGLMLLAPMRNKNTYLIDSKGESVREWKSKYGPGMSAYLLSGGRLLRPATLGAVEGGLFSSGGAAGRIEMFDWSGALVWEYEYHSALHSLHHDIEYLPNGNILAMAWQVKTEAEALAAGRRPEYLSDGELWYESIIEIKPTYPKGGEIVWRWDSWDHVVQQFDSKKDNYGFALSSNIDLNYINGEGKRAGKADWLHSNSIDYDPDTGLILLSVHAFSEVWIIDRNDPDAGISYRFGNDVAWDRFCGRDQLLYKQHDASWVDSPEGGRKSVLVFNNGTGRQGDNYSEVVEFRLPPEVFDGPVMHDDMRPPEVVWSYSAPEKSDFYARNISGAQRLPNGNTLICSGPQGRIFEVTPEKEVVWEYVNPHLVEKGPVENRRSREGRRGGDSGTAKPVFRAYKYSLPYIAGKERVAASAVSRSDIADGE